MADTNQGTSPRKTLPLHAEYERLGARMGAFGEWAVPLYFSSILAEHECVRSKAGVFDVSHMGEFWVRGKAAAVEINRWITNDVGKLKDGQALYSPVCRDEGGIVDDVVVFRVASDMYMIVVNAANIEKDFAWFRSRLSAGIHLEDRSDQTALLAVQGPLSPEVVCAALEVELEELSYYHFMTFNSHFGEIMLSRTGYTGEVGFELFCGKSEAPGLWQCLFKAGAAYGLQPIGFGARDTLRLECRYLLYGHDMTDQTSPLQARLGWAVAWDKAEFIGKTALEAERKNGVNEKLIGFVMTDRAIAREGCDVKSEGRTIGRVTSGTFSPTLKRSIGLAYVQSSSADVGRLIEIEIRRKPEQARIVKTPFYQPLSKDKI